MTLSIIITALSTHIVYAKYITIDKENVTFDIATPIFKIENGEKIEIDETNNIGYYEFSIKNFNETHVSEIDFLYTIEIISNLDETIQFELYNQETQIPLKNLKTEKLLIKGKEKTEQKYKLKIIYDISKENSGQEISKEVQIKVCSEQNL